MAIPRFGLMSHDAFRSFIGEVRRSVVFERRMRYEANAFHLCHVNVAARIDPETENGKPTRDLRLSVDEWPMARPAYTYVLPRVALAFAFKQKVPELTISYEDRDLAH